MNYLKWVLLPLTLLFFAACGQPKIVAATPVKNEITAASSQENLHEMIHLLAIYKKYEILSDNGSTEMRIKYSRLVDQNGTVSSMTYDVVNDANSVTMSYVDSENYGYDNGQISGKYRWYIDHFNNTLKKMYDDPEYLQRMKTIVENPTLHH